MMRSKLTRSIALLLALVALVGLVACGGDSSGAASTPAGSTGGTTSTPAATGDGTSAKDTFKMGMSAEPTSMDPATAKDMVTWMFVMQSYDTLIKYDTATQTFVPGLASEWKVNEDSSEVEFTLRDGVTFQNGDPMTMDDVLFSLNRALTSEYTAQLTPSIDRFEAVDDTTLKMVLKYGYAPILEIMVTPCWGIMNKAYVEAAEAEGKDVGRIESCGTGAYIMKEWRSGEKLIFEAFDGYYGGAPAVKSVEAILIADQSAGAIALEDGTLDYYYGVQESDIEHLKSVPSLTVYTIELGADLYDITFNVTDGIFTDKRLRQAVAYALNRDEILLGGHEGNGIVNNCICASGAFGYLPDYEYYEQDLEKAKALVAEAGYPDGVDVVFKQDSSKYYMPSAEIVQAQLKKVGINVTFEKLERSAWLDTVASNRDYEATLRSTTQVVLDADYILTRRLTAEMLGGGNNYSGYNNPEFEKLLVEARSSSDNAHREDIYRQCYDIIKEDVPLIPLCSTYTQQVVNAKIQGWAQHPRYMNPWSEIYFVD
ncbi:ABC transporter substrate-binding protein [Ruminococcaceae bacterium OttesenSCG-928-A11]|nr:ABC transporter substrate-binding protein [Ruminococcaceae bacterium OttesenSCG-928-A11]